MTRSSAHEEKPAEAERGVPPCTPNGADPRAAPRPPRQGAAARHLPLDRQGRLRHRALAGRGRRATSNAGDGPCRGGREPTPWAERFEDRFLDPLPPCDEALAGRAERSAQRGVEAILHPSPPRRERSRRPVAAPRGHLLRRAGERRTDPTTATSDETSSASVAIQRWKDVFWEHYFSDVRVPVRRIGTPRTEAGLQDAALRRVSPVPAVDDRRAATGRGLRRGVGCNRTGRVRPAPAARRPPDGGGGAGGGPASERGERDAGPGTACGWRRAAAGSTPARGRRGGIPKTQDKASADRQDPRRRRAPVDDLQPTARGARPDRPGARLRRGGGGAALSGGLDRPPAVVRRRERAWLVRELPTYSQDTVEEVVRGARTGDATLARAQRAAPTSAPGCPACSAARGRPAWPRRRTTSSPRCSGASRAATSSGAARS